MPRVTSTEFQQSVGTYSDAAMREPVVITSHSRDRLVLMDIEEYNRLKTLEEDMRQKTVEERYNKHRDTYLDLAKR